MNRRSVFVGALALATSVMFSHASAQAAPKKILFLTHSAGFKHGSLALAEKTVTEMGKKSGLFEVTTLEGYKQDAKAIDLSMISADYLKQFDGLIMFTTGELPLNDSQKQAILDFVKNGKCWIGTHSASDTLYTWPAYGELVGAYFKTHHPPNKDLTLKVEDKKHPATKMLGDSITIADEFYQFIDAPDPNKPVQWSRDRVHVLLSVDTEKSDLAPQQMVKGGDYGIAWCQNVGKGRSFYTALGHRDEVWTNPVFQDHLLGGIKWALGLEPGDATPSAKLKGQAKPQGKPQIKIK